MPTYDYHCPNCGRDFDAVRPISGYQYAECECGCPTAAHRFTIPKKAYIDRVVHEFVSYNMDHNPVLVRGRKHWNSLLRERGLVEAVHKE